MKIPDAKAAVDKEWERLGHLAAWEVTKVKSKKEDIETTQKEGRTVHFATLMDLCHLKNSELEQKFQQYRGGVVLRGDVVKNCLIRCIYGVRLVSVTNDGRERHWTLLPDYHDAQDKQATQYQLTPKLTWGTLQNC